MARILIPYKPRYPEAHRLLESRRFACLVAHRRFGKTVLAVNHLIKQALICKRPAGHFGYVAPFRTQAKAVAWDYLKHYTAPVANVKINESELSVTVPSASGSARIRIFGADNPDALRGLYFDGVVLDEVAQMKTEVWEEIIQPALSDRKGFAVFIGTPKGINLFSSIWHHATAEQAAGNPEWGALRYPCTETGALDADEIERLRQELSDNKFRQEMLCDFTASSDDVLISLDDCQKGLTATPDPELARQWPLIIGVDVARFGGDATVFFPRQGLIASEPVILRQKSNTDVAARLIQLIGEMRPALVNIDQGQGTGVIDLVREACAGLACVIIEIPFGSQALDNARFVNRRAEMWKLLGDWLKGGGSLPRERACAETLLAELSAPTFSYDAAGRMKLEAKEEIKKRLGRSTDLADALALTFAIRTGPTGLPQTTSRPARNYRKKIYDPFA